jgi:hypothetical protein
VPESCPSSRRAGFPDDTSVFAPYELAEKILGIGGRHVGGSEISKWREAGDIRLSKSQVRGMGEGGKEKMGGEEVETPSKGRQGIAERMLWAGYGVEWLEGGVRSDH